MVGRSVGASGIPPALIGGTEARGVSSGKYSGEYSGRPADPWAFYRLFRDGWPEFIRRNFRNTTEAAAFFSVDEKTARGWAEGVTAPRGQVVAYAAATMPQQVAQLIGTAA